ncbi:MAG TPA: DUF1553 domain-containing protein [Chthonomonadaceae bacterium]|nr:DUF1553 domain-containing protein [Chthonomonadaceae bacterium]
MRRSLLLSLLLVLLSASLFAAPPKKSSPNGTAASVVKAVDFNRDIRPILSENCFKCHGFDVNQRQAGLRLDTPEGAFGKRSSGRSAIVPGHIQESLLVTRIMAQDASQMPPVSSGKKLTAAQIETLKRWVAQGAKYAEHWAFVAPVRPPLPKVAGVGWVKNPVDRFILARLEQEGLKPSPEADKATLLRRVALDLTGLPPTSAELNAFLADNRPDAYERVVDRLLASPHYGERMASVWLDLARYADTHGFHIDSQREMWRWREWVIDAYNHNLPYDQFVIQQLAGDLLPNATLDQKIASGFNRNHPINFEGGAIPEEYQAAYIEDRIDTTATTFMGLTLRCAQCHDHKYDPFTQKDYYRFYAYFNNITEQGLDGQQGNAVPYMKAPNPEQQEQMDALVRKVAEVEGARTARAAEAAPEEAVWEKTTLAALDKAAPVSAGMVAHFDLEENSGTQVVNTVNKVAAPIVGKAAWAAGKVGKALSLDGKSYADLGNAVTFERTDKFSYGAWVYPTAGGAMTVLSKMDDASNFRGWDMYLGDGRVYIHIIHEWEKNAIRVNTKMAIPQNQWTHVFATYDGSSKAKGVHVYINGKPAELDVTHDALTDTIQTGKPVTIGRRTPGAPFKGMLDEVRIYNRELTAVEVAQLSGFDTLRPMLATPAEKRTKDQQQAVAAYYLDNYDAKYKQINAELAEWKQKQTDLDKTIPTTMVMQEREKPRDTFMLIRGQYDQHGDKVTAGVPAVFPPLPTDAPNNRLGMAKWLASPTHPLTARVAVNRTWQMLFGAGLVRTPENFGLQGELPTHPELLDWLATDFISPFPPLSPSGGPWDTKALVRLLVTSATYRQSSHVTPQLEAKDPENRLWAHGPRFRLPAEFVRDQALALSGLLVDKIGGPSVHPYQPPGLWEELAFGGGFSAQTYVQDHGEALYRRSMYTFWKRTCPPPSLQTFDAPEREFCMVRRSVTNTPLQALVLMNDPTYIEASRKLAERIMTEGGATSEARIAWAFRLATCRLPKEAEKRALLTLYNVQYATFARDNAAAMKLLSVGESKRNEKLDTRELAAWASVASVLLNLDETITKN